jgi:hypothetical protein
MYGQALAFTPEETDDRPVKFLQTFPAAESDAASAEFIADEGNG